MSQIVQVLLQDIGEILASNLVLLPALTQTNMVMFLIIVNAIRAMLTVIPAQDRLSFVLLAQLTIIYLDLFVTQHVLLQATQSLQQIDVLYSIIQFKIIIFLTIHYLPNQTYKKNSKKKRRYDKKCMNLKLI